MDSNARMLTFTALNILATVSILTYRGATTENLRVQALTIVVKDGHDLVTIGQSPIGRGHGLFVRDSHGAVRLSMELVEDRDPEFALRRPDGEADVELRSMPVVNSSTLTFYEQGTGGSPELRRIEIGVESKLEAGEVPGMPGSARLSTGRTAWITLRDREGKAVQAWSSPGNPPR